jgi:mannose-6-phosphate isomerase-like protein (cupin superfamily)
MNIQEYIATGILEQYCLGMLTDEEMREVATLRSRYPEVETEIRTIEASLEERAGALALEPPPALREQIWNTLENLNKEKNISLQDLPLINRFTNHKAWLGIVKPLIPPQMQEDRVIKVLRESDKVIQMLVVSKSHFEDEVHINEHESFIILEGECECTVGDKVFRLKPGGFTEIPLHTSHDVRVLTPHVTAILQRIAV